MKFKYTSFFILLMVLNSCAPKASDDEQIEYQELSYSDIVALVFADSSNVQEWHDTPISQEAVEFVEMSMGLSNHNCGERVMVTNSSEERVYVTVTSTYPFDESPWDFGKEYTIRPNEIKYIGNTMLCNGAERTPFAWKIEGASFSSGD